jgi:protein-disulfide isomerase
MEPSKSLFDHIPSKTSFLLGAAAAVFGLGTLGFVLLGSCMVSGSCPDFGGAKAAAAPSAAAPTPSAVLPEPTGDVPAVTDQDWIRGDKDAKITLIEYSDFECPFCSRFVPTVEQVLAAYPDDVRLVYRHFPLSFHPEAEPAAEAAECAGEQGKFWEYHDGLFDNQTSLSAAYYPQLAATLGLNASKFKDCLASDRHLAKIRQQAQTGAAAGVNGTPGSFVVDPDGNATPIKGALPFESVKAVIDAVLAAS